MDRPDVNVTKPRLCPMTNEEWRQRIREAQEAARARQRAAVEGRAEAARQELAKQREIAEYLAAHAVGASCAEPESSAPPPGPPYRTAAELAAHLPVLRDPVISEAMAALSDEPPAPPAPAVDDADGLPPADDVPGNVAFLGRLGRRSGQASAPEWPGAQQERGDTQ